MVVPSRSNLTFWRGARSLMQVLRSVGGVGLGHCNQAPVAHDVRLPRSPERRSPPFRADGGGAAAQGCWIGGDGPPGVATAHRTLLTFYAPYPGCNLGKAGNPQVNLGNRQAPAPTVSPTASPRARAGRGSARPASSGPRR